MDLASYAALAVRLVNAPPPDSPAQLRELTGDAADRSAVDVPEATPEELAALRALRDRLRAVFEQATAGAAHAAVDALNELLAAHPIRPRISGHDAQNWHFHLNESGGACAQYAAQAVMGLATVVTRLGPDRLGTCDAARCGNAFIDTSTNRSRRYCSDRCASRANVAAYRARRKSRAGLGAGQ